MDPFQLHQQAYALGQKGQYIEAIALGVRAIKLMRAQLAPDDPNLAVALTNLGSWYAAINNWRDALTCYAQGLALKIRNEGPDSPGCAKTLCRAAHCHQELGEQAAATDQYRQSIAIFDQHPDANPVLYITAVRGLAFLLAEAGRNPEALRYMRQGVRLAAAKVREGQDDFLPMLQELCHASLALGDLEELLRSLAATLGEEPACSYLDGIGGELVEQFRVRAIAVPELPRDKDWVRDQQAAMLALSQNDEQAVDAARRAYDTAHRKFGPRSLPAALSANLIAVSYQQLDRRKEALPWLVECLEAMRASVPRTEPVYAGIVRDTGNAFREAGQFTEAEPLLQEAIQLCRAREPLDPPALALAIHDLAAARAEAGAVAAAEKAYDDARSVLAPGDPLRDLLEIRRRVMAQIVISQARMTPDHSNRLSELQEKRIALPAADALREAEALQAETSEYLDPRAFENLLLLEIVGDLQMDLGRLPEATETLQSAWNIGRQYHADAGPGFASESLASAYMAMGRYREAVPLFAEAVEFAGRHFGAGNPRTLQVINAQSANLIELGRYAEADNLLLASCEALRGLSPAGTTLAAMLGNLAVLYRRMGKFSEAEPLYAESAELLRDAVGGESEEYAKALNNYALFCDGVGLDDKARELYGKALAIVNRHGKQNDPERGRILGNLGLLLGKCGDEKRAEEMLREACEIRLAVLGERHHDYLASLHNLGCLQHTLGRDSDAKATLDRVLELKEQVLGRDHDSWAITASALAEICDELGDSARALLLFGQSTLTRRRALGDRHPATARALGMDAQFHWLHGDTDNARPRFLEALDIYRYLVGSFFPGMTESERAHYWDEIRRLFDVFATFALDVYGKRSDVAGDLFDVQLFARALVLDSVLAARRAVLAADDPEVLKVYESWLAKKREMVSLVTVRGIPRSDGNAAQALAMEIDELEKQLARKSRPFARASDLRECRWRDVQRSLAPGEAAIEIVRTGSSYVALILRQDTVAGPKLLEIGNADSLELAGLKRYEDTLGTISSASWKDYWEPVARELQGIARAYVSPDGVYGLIDLNALHNGEDFLMDAIDLRVVTSTRELLGQEYDARGERTAVLFGRPAYHLAPAEVAGPEGAKHDPAFQFPDLPGTELEVREIESVLRGRDWKVDVRVEAHACRAALRKVRNPRVLHLATHGFFLDPRETHYQIPGKGTIAIVNEQDPEGQPGFAELERHLLASGSRKMSGLVEQRASDRNPFTLNPLFRSGLALAGAAAGLDSDDGLFTAYEAASLELTDTQLVTLSACESGLGVARAGEGVIGLGRAFRAAGARFLLTAVRPVDDSIARELMQAFYTSWLDCGDLREAFRHTQRAQCARYRLPMLWAGFVLVGR